MSRKLIYVLFLLLAVSCSSPRNYVKRAVRLMDRNGLFAEGDQWDAAREKALSQKPATIEDAQEVVREALKVAGGKHSFILPSSKVEKLAKIEWQMPSVEILNDNIVQIKLPDFSGNQYEGRKYEQTVIDGVPGNVVGAIIDLRGNTGGNMYPMIASVHRFIDDGETMLKFKNRTHTNVIPLSYILRCEGIEAQDPLDCPVAILTDSLTASSGEATLICFRGQENVRTFGTPTAGYASANRPFKMADGSHLVITTGCDVARTGEVFCDDPIVPDILTDHPVEDAVAWIRTIIQKESTASRHSTSASDF